ncbi:DUF4232 domain-containing protein [Streptomyces sp. NPDC006654]|uniref:DUF4232 domain-containing protein n=1 Tax=Streptomyces sp. NPDC006654 TaxID=3156897 RepID=UPI0033D007D5
MHRRIRTALMATAAVSAGLLMTACQDNGTSVTPSATTSAAGTSAAKPKSDQETTAQKTGTESGGGNKASGTAPSAAESGHALDKKGYGQGCGANDISWSTRSETQAGGYILIMAKAKPGITCSLDGSLPTVAFGSDGTEAKPAEQVAGEPITLRAGVTAYAGVNPKTTANDGGKELNEIIVGVGDEDPNPVSLKVGKIVVDKPIVTNWHTSASQAVPFAS